MIEIKMDERQQKLFDTSVFFGKLLLVGAVFHALLYLYPDTSWFQARLAELVAAILGLSGIENTVTGVFIVIGDVTYRITQDCLGWKSMMAFIGLVFASGSLREHRDFLGLGLAAILLANIVRIVSTVYLSHTGIISFDIIHDTLWRWGLTAIVFMLWASWFLRKEEQPFKSAKKRLL